MKGLFNLDNPFMQFLSRVGDMIIVNALFLICSIPIITIGAATAALRKVTQDIACDEEKGVVKTFFRAFKENFKQATIAWLIILVFLFGMGCNFLLAATYFTGTAALILKGVLVLIAVITLAITSYLFPLIARYENTLKEHAVNACILAVVKLPRTIAMVLLNILPFLIMYFSLQIFFDTLVFWFTVGFGFTGYICSALLVPVFKEMEQTDGPDIQILN